MNSLLQLDMANTIFDLTNRLEDIQILIASVCANYFSDNPRTVNMNMLCMQYREYSSLVQMANGLLFSLEKDYRKLQQLMLAECQNEKPHTSSSNQES